MGLAASYAGRVGLTAWRRKSTLLGVAAGLALLVLCLQYNAASRPEEAAPALALDGGRTSGGGGEAAAPQARTLRHHAAGEDPVAVGGSVQFVKAPPPAAATSGGGSGGDGGGGIVVVEEVATVVPEQQPSRDEVARRKDAAAQYQAANGVPAPAPSAQALQPQYSSYDQQGLYQMGIPYANIDPRKPYVPGHRLVHLDLKGAPPKVSFLKRLFPLFKQLGATGILLEWEDMFPFKGQLAPLSATNCYSLQDVRDILQAAKGSELEVIPLVQTFGHVEFALKHSLFSSLREVPESPQALCPSLNASMEFVEKLIEQVMEVHHNVRFLHIGCDEVFQLGECPRCRNQLRESLFLSHVSRVATFVRQHYPTTTPIIWDDMLRHLSPQSLEEFRMGELVEPMVWVYAEDVYRFVPSMVWDKFAAVFPYVWSASAFKGAFGETLYIPNVKRHLENNLRWLEVMAAEGPKFKGGFRGIAITGWQRYDHFAVLCELLPAAVPSLAVNLLATTHGYFNQSLRSKLASSLGCSRPLPPTNTRFSNTAEAVVNLNSDPYLWDKMGRCFFPGSPFFRLTYRLHAAELEVKEYLESVTLSKGWMTDYNVRRNFSSPLRVDELMADHPRVYHTLTTLARSARDAMEDVFDSYTITEWVEQRIYPGIMQLEKLQHEANRLKAVRTWPRRPFPPLRDLRRLGVPMPEDGDGNSTPRPPGK